MSARRAKLVLGLLAVLACGPAREGHQEAQEEELGLRVVGHRGASGLAPENTLEALERARESGVREVEIDVRLSRDGVPVLFHDAVLDRKTQLEGRVAELDWPALQRAEIGRWFHREHPEVSVRYIGAGIARLDRVLDRYGEEFFWHIELKGRDEALPAAVLTAVDRAGVRGRAELSSFNVGQLLAVRELAADLPLCLIVPRTRKGAEPWETARRRLTPDEGLDRAIEHGFAAIALALHDVSEVRLRRARKHGVAVRAFRVSDDEDLARAVALGVDAITVERPDRALAFLDGRAPQGPPSEPAPVR